MKLTEVCLYSRDFARTALLLERYFGAVRGEAAREPGMQLESCTLTLPQGGSIRLLMRPGLADGSEYPLHTGFSAAVFSVGSEEKVREITMAIYKDGHTVMAMPQRTYDGRFESIVLDPDGNQLVITV